MNNNVNDIINESAWKKASAFIEEKYGKKIEYRFMTESIADDNIQDKKFFVWGDDLVVPLKYKSTDLGHVIVARGATLQNDQQTETADLIQFLIEPQVYNKVLKLRLNSLTQGSHNQNDNVIELFSRNNEIDSNRIVIDDDKIPKKLISKFIHLRSKSAHVRHKVAMKIHEMAGTIVLLRLQDFYDGSKPMTQDEVDQLNLDATALFVDDILDLNPNQLEAIQLFSKCKAEGHYVVIVGSSLNEDQIQHLSYSRQFKNDLIGLSYDADRVPLNQQASDEVLDLLFFNDGDIIS